MNNRILRSSCTFFLLSYVFTWLFWIPRALASQGYLNLPTDPVIFQITGAFGPAAAAICLTFARDGKMGLRNLLANYAHWRISWKWYASVLLTRPLIWLTVVMGYTVFSQRTFAWHLTDPGFFFLYLLSQLLVVGVGEELGWSGYALPQLQAHYGFLKANLLLGIIWGLWHLPFFYTVGDSQYGASILFFVLKLTAFRYLFSLAYTQTSSLLLPGLFHVSFNVLTEQIPLSPNDPWAIGLSVIFTAILLLLVSQNGWLRSGHSSNETTAQIPTT